MLKKGLNYTGSKYKLLPQLLPMFPKDIGFFIEPFVGGCNIAPNIDSKYYWFNDKSIHIMCIYNIMKHYSSDYIVQSVKNLIGQYELTNKNKEGYLKLRNDFNSTPHNKTFTKNIELITLICYSFNNIIRFNSNNKFNAPFGERTFNPVLEKNIIELSNFIKEKNPKLTAHSFKYFVEQFKKLYPQIKENIFIYLDPPYQGTDTSYNIGWGREQELQIIDLIIFCRNNNIKFGYSNAILNNIMPDSVKYIVENFKDINIIEINHSYKNSNHQRKLDKELKEVYITNVKI